MGTYRKLILKIMGKKVYKYPEIGQYRNVIQAITNATRYSGKDDNGDPIYNNDPLPIIKYKFTPKGHGTNGGLIWEYDEEKYDYVFYNQSRERIITPMGDNMGFSTFIHRIGEERLYKEMVLPILALIIGDVDERGYHIKINDDGTKSAISHPRVQVYGEWAGKGIQKKVGIAEVEKFFMIFGIKVNGIWVPEDVLSQIKLPEERIFNVCDYASHELVIDFNNPGDYTDQFDKWVEEIENECPIAKYFGIENGIGEGWVAKPVDPMWHHGRYFFKIKGTKHVGTGKNKDKKKKIQVDVEKINNMNSLIDSIVTNERLEQGIVKLGEKGLEVGTKSTGAYLKWLYDDIMKEELDTILKNGFEPKEISKVISNKGRKWYFNYLDKLVGL